MKYSTPVYFQLFPKAVYNTESGNYDDVQPEEVLRYANVTDTGSRTLRTDYARIKEGSKVIRLQQKYSRPFESIRIGRKIYKVETEISSDYKQAFIVNEVQ